MSIKIRTTYGVGGAGMAGTPTALHRPIAEVLRGMVDDIGSQSVGTVATLVEIDATNLAEALLLVNEIKAALNTATAAAATTGQTVEKG